MGIAKEDILNLSIEDRLHLLEVIWESMADEPGTLQLSDAQKQELDRRLDSLQLDPSSGRSWKDVRDTILNRK
ncbi:antitoxin [Geomonas limicola]|uniref:Antitoxin n=1 Tax=Geomonas limicola TaxID=2740186 RepID=A0A6V8NC92_9BACT|nr:addiction module protein [Geomonas limicola]GFO70050.1 antitoxin [Geomonas limicola]